jgi:outer membrane protein assembly factor BamB
MRRRFHCLRSTPAILMLGIFCFSGGGTEAQPAGGSTEWPQWRGPNRDGMSSLVPLSKQWPESGPSQMWRKPLGEGFSGISISGSRLYTMYSKGTHEYVVCLNAADGGELWKVRTGATYMEGHGNGPRSTPTVDGDRIYAMGASGELFALDAGTGKVIWRRDLRLEFGSNRPTWGFSSSPLIEGQLVLIEAGGSNNRSLMAFDKETGEVVWGSGEDPIGYSSPIALNSGGTRQILFFTGAALVSLSPASGEPYWRYEWPNSSHINVAMPLFIAPDRVFVSSSYSTGGAMVQITQADSGLGVAELWFTKKMKNHFNTSVYHEGMLYGFDNAILTCLDAETGEVSWQARGYGKGSLIYADGHLIVLSDDGRLAIVEANPQAHVEVGSAQILSGRCWTAPSLANGRLYLRNLEEIVSLDIEGKS